MAKEGLLSKTVPDWTVVLGLAVLLAALPGILVLNSSRLACATAKEVVADPKHPDNQLTVNQGTIIKVTLPRATWPIGAFPEVSNTNSAIVAVDQTPCGWPQSDEAMSFDFRAVAEGTAQLATVGPNPNAFSPFAFAWTPVAWDVTVSGPDDKPLKLVGIEVSIAVVAGVFIFYRGRQGRPRPGTGQ